MSYKLSEAIIFELQDGIGLSDPKEESLHKYKEVNDWLKTMVYARSKFPNFTISTKDSLRILDDTIMSDKMDATHAGLIQYIYNAWARELGVVLKPDIFFYTIISELKEKIIDDPISYHDLFTKVDKKEDIVVINLTIERLVVALKERIQNQELFNIITQTTFSTEPKHFKKVVGITMANMATPFYTYISTKCGIPVIAVLGSEMDWQVLLMAVIDLKKIFSNLTIISQYLLKVMELINNFIKSVFKNKNSDFFKNMFTYQKNSRCESGHSPVIIDGWIRDLYIEKHDWLRNYPSHLSCLPYKNRDDPKNVKYYFYACGLTSSRIVDNFLYPEYNIIHCQLMDNNAEEIFDILANKNM